MAKLTIADASRVAGVARSTLYRALQKGRLSADPDGHIDTAELLRAGYTLQRSAQQTKDISLHDSTPRNTDAQQPSSLTDTQAFHDLQQERNMLRLERDMLRQQLEAAQMREQAAKEREREAREERQAARERETLLLRMVEQAQQRYDRLLDMPRSAAIPPPSPQDAPGATQASAPPPQTPHAPQTPPGDPRGAMRRRIVALLRDHPEGLTTAEMRSGWGGRSLADTLLGMRKYGLVQRVGHGRYVAAAPSGQER